MSQKTNKLIWEYVESFTIAIVLALIIRTFVVQPFKIPTGSMHTTLLEGDRILVNKFIYRFKEPEIGDVVVFKSPETANKDYIKRLAAQNGDKIQIKNGRIWLNNQLLDHPDIFRQNYYYNRGEYAAEDSVYVVPEGKMFVLGDNSLSSHDSRYWGPFARKYLEGKAFLIFWPPHRIRIIR